MNTVKVKVNKRRIAVIIAVIIVIIAAILGWLTLRQSTLNPSSQDTIIGASVVNVSSSVPGRIQTINVKENGKVKRGDVMFTIDPWLYRLQVEQAKAEVQMAQAAWDTQHRTMVAEQSNAAITDEQVIRARANLQLATQTLARLQPMLAKGYVTAQQIDDARTAKKDAEISLRQALKQTVASAALVTSAEESEALLKARRAVLAIAERQLENTEIRAPHDGLVVGLNVSAGEYVVPDQAIFTLINSEHWHASAYFRESELAHIKVGDCATVYVLADRQRALQGKVEGIGWGISSEDQINIPRNLPYVPKSLNWVRVEQRFPVRINLQDPPAELMRIGASAVAIVRNEDGC